MRHLAMQIRHLDRVAVHEAQHTHARTRQVRRGRTSQAAGTNKKYLGIS